MPESGRQQFHFSYTRLPFGSHEMKKRKKKQNKTKKTLHKCYQREQAINGSNNPLRNMVFRRDIKKQRLNAAGWGTETQVHPNRSWNRSHPFPPRTLLRTEMRLHIWMLTALTNFLEFTTIHSNKVIYFAQVCRICIFNNLYRHQ